MEEYIKEGNLFEFYKFMSDESKLEKTSEVLQVINNSYSSSLYLRTLQSIYIENFKGIDVEIKNEINNEINKFLKKNIDKIKVEDASYSESGLDMRLSLNLEDGTSMYFDESDFNLSNVSDCNNQFYTKIYESTKNKNDKKINEKLKNLKIVGDNDSEKIRNIIETNSDYSNYLNEELIFLYFSSKFLNKKDKIICFKKGLEKKLEHLKKELEINKGRKLRYYNITNNFIVAVNLTKFLELDYKKLFDSVYLNVPSKTALFKHIMDYQKNENRVIIKSEEYFENFGKKEEPEDNSDFKELCYEMLNYKKDCYNTINELLEDKKEYLNYKLSKLV